MPRLPTEEAGAERGDPCTRESDLREAAESREATASVLATAACLRAELFTFGLPFGPESAAAAAEALRWCRKALIHAEEWVRSRGAPADPFLVAWKLTRWRRLALWRAGRLAAHVQSKLAEHPSTAATDAPSSGLLPPIGNCATQHRRRR